MVPVADSRTAALLDVAAVVVVNALVHAWLRRLELGVAMSAFGIVVSLALATWLLRRRAVRWRDLGLRSPTLFGGAAAWTVGLFVVDLFLLPAILEPLCGALGMAPQNLHAFDDLKGNTPKYLLMLLPITWGTAAFGEEIIYRGFIFTRLTDALGRTRWAIAVALLIQAVLFSLGHVYLGPRGMINAGALGLVAGLVYVTNGRNLWPLIIAHGLVDSVGITVLYLGIAHG